MKAALGPQIILKCFNISRPTGGGGKGGWLKGMELETVVEEDDKTEGVDEDGVKGDRPGDDDGDETTKESFPEIGVGD